MRTTPLVSTLGLALTGLAAAWSPLVRPSIVYAPGPQEAGAQQGQAEPQSQTPEPPGALAPAHAARTLPPWGAEGGALAGDLGIVSFADLDEILIWRDGKSPNGQAALRQLLELRVIESLAREENVVISDDTIRERFNQLDTEARQNGVAGGLVEFIRSQGVDPAEFREYLRLGIIHETLTRRALGLAEGTPVSGDQQQLWLEETLKARGYEPKEHPWNDGIVCVSGDLAITRKEFGEHLRKQVDPADAREACYLTLLERAVVARMPAITAEGISKALDREIERRSAEAEANPTYQGASYSQLLDARGLSIEAVRRDPAIRAAALAHQIIDQTHDEDALKKVYADERTYFDGLHGESVEVRVVFLNATDDENDPLKRPSYGQVETKLQGMKEAIQGPADFARVVEIHSQDAGTREKGGLLGRLTRENPGAPAGLRAAVFAAIDAAPERNVEGQIVGPIRIANGCVLALLSGRQPAPTWTAMRVHVHRELRRRYLADTLPPEAVRTFLDETK